MTKLPTEILMMIANEIDCYDCYKTFINTTNLPMNLNNEKLDHLIFAPTCNKCHKLRNKNADLFWEYQLTLSNKRNNQNNQIKPKFIKFK